MTEKKISEKELVFEMLDETDLDLVLMVFNENTKNKNLQFKRMKAKQHIHANKSRVNRLTPFEFLCEQLSSKKFKNIPLTKLLRMFNNPAMEIPTITKYFTLRTYHPKFFNEHYEEFEANILNGRFFLEGIQVFQSEEELRSYYLDTFGGDKAIQDIYLETLIDWYEANLHTLDKEFELLKGWTTCEFDAKRRQLREDYDDTALVLAFLKVGELDRELKDIFLHHVLNDCLAKCDLKLTSEMGELNKELLERLESLSQSNKELKKAIKAQEQECKTLKKEIEREHQETEKAWQAELESLKTALKQEELIQQHQKGELSTLKEVNAHLVEQLKLQEDLAASYQWSLQSDYTEAGIIVLHKSTLLYAKHLFPDIQFVTDLTAVDLEKPRKQLLIQKYGLPHLQRRQAQLFAQEQGLQVFELDGREEREQIMALSGHLTQLNLAE